jgi:FecR protein
MTLVALVCALIGGVVAAFWVRHKQGGEMKELVSAARVERVDGEVGVGRNPAGVSNTQKDGTDSQQWVQATTNTPVSVGDHIYARDNSHASVAFTGRNFARLNPRTDLDVMYLAPDRTQLALRDGSCVFDVGALSQGQLFEVATPFGAVDFDQPGLYQVGYNDNGSAYVSVLNGLARVVGLGGTGQVSKGEMLTLLGQTAADVALSRLDPTYAGGLLNDYYGYRYPRTYDGRYNDYNAYLNDPSYYDPYNRYTSYRYVSDVIPGVEDLDDYGDWQNVSGYGQCWHPRVDAGWTPYQQGYWAVDEPFGMTWVSSEPWGYAPYHYGRWASVNNQWFWVPEAVNTRPAYSPALVAFLPLTQANEVGWVPLGPGDSYGLLRSELATALRRRRTGGAADR